MNAAERGELPARLNESAEINEERYALRVLRGDFERIISRDGVHADPLAAFSAAEPAPSNSETDL